MAYEAVIEHRCIRASPLPHLGASDSRVAWNPLVFEAVEEPRRRRVSQQFPLRLIEQRHAIATSLRWIRRSNPKMGNAMLGLQYVGMALNHWKQWQPTMYKEAKKDGTLNELAQTASKEAARQVASLMEAGYQKHEAEEMVLPELILLRPEKGL